MDKMKYMYLCMTCPLFNTNSTFKDMFSTNPFSVGFQGLDTVRRRCIDIIVRKVGNIL